MLQKHPAKSCLNAKCGLVAKSNTQQNPASLVDISQQIQIRLIASVFIKHLK